MIFAWFGYDPGPCPVDDAPHTTCVSPDYALTQPLLPAARSGPTCVMAVPRPFGLDPAVAPIQSPAVTASVTTKTYRRGRPSDDAIDRLAQRVARREPRNG